MVGEFVGEGKGGLPLCAGRVVPSHSRWVVVCCVSNTPLPPESCLQLFLAVKYEPAVFWQNVCIS